MKLIPFLLFCELLHQHVYALKILAIVSLPLHSHYMAFGPLFDGLAARGHSVTVLNNFPNKKPVRNMRFINLNAQAPQFTNMSDYEDRNPAYVHLQNFNNHIKSSSMLMENCKNLLTNEDAKAHLAEAVKYDVIFVEQFMSECELAYATAFYDAPVIGVTSHVMLPWSYKRLGIPFNFGADAFYFSNSGPNPSLYGKLEAMVLDVLSNTVMQGLVQDSVKDAFNAVFPEVKVDIDKSWRERVKMMFVYQHHSITGARLLPPQVLEIGGLHIDHPKPLPQDLEQFLSDAKSGAVYVSFGSNLKMNTMTEAKMNEFLKAFKGLPQKVIWKYENASLPKGYDNVYTGNWMPQLDILCHPKVVAFVSHGGMLSLSEAAYCGKPLLIIPFFGDQYSNAAAAVASGIGKILYFQHLTAETLSKAIAGLNSHDMRKAAQEVHLQWRDRPVPIMDSAIYWTEYVARHRRSPPSLPSRNLSWFESYYLDVYSVVIVILFALFALLYAICKLLLTRIKRAFSPQRKPKYL